MRRNRCCICCCSGIRAALSKVLQHVAGEPGESGSRCAWGERVRGSGWSWGMMYHRHRGVVSRSPPLSAPSTNLRLQFLPPPPPPCEIHIAVENPSTLPAWILFGAVTYFLHHDPPVCYWVHVPHLYSQKRVNAAGAMHVSSFFGILKRFKLPVKLPTAACSFMIHYSSQNVPSKRVHSWEKLLSRLSGFHQYASVRGQEGNWSITIKGPRQDAWSFVLLFSSVLENLGYQRWLSAVMAENQSDPPSWKL